MEILFVDDNEVRHGIFDDIASREFEVTHARSVDEAILFVRNKTFDAICLDHDMAERRTGEAVAVELILNKLPKYVWIHSWNPAGVKAIAAVVSGKVPFCAVPFSNRTVKEVLKRVKALEVSGSHDDNGVQPDLK